MAQAGITIIVSEPVTKGSSLTVVRCFVTIGAMSHIGGSSVTTRGASLCLSTM
ncbi:hypothetical protein ACFLYN_01785 [Chloroflexota bacterium]